MNAIHILGSTALLFLAGCTAPPSAQDKKDKDHLLHHPSAAHSPAATKSDQQMAQMREMHRKMMAAKTPQERQALMAEHMKVMQGGMSMMCQMGTASSPQAGAPSEEAMRRCTAMKDMTMQMMQDREKLQSPVR